MTTQPVLIGGGWREANQSKTFQAANPRTGELLSDVYPVSGWQDCEEAIAAAASAAEGIRRCGPEKVSEFLERFAERIEQRRDELVNVATDETGLPATPRLMDIELPRTTSQLRQAARAAHDGGWTLATIDTAANIRSYLAPIGPVVVFGPNNFPFAFGSMSGGDFAAAIGAGNPVIAKANSSHPMTTRLFAEEAHAAAAETGMPANTVQLIYRTEHSDGERLVADPRIGAIGYTGSRSAGLQLKSAADRAGNPIYLELSSVNPVLILPGAISARAATIAEEFTTSCLMGTGQFCTNPGFVLLLDGEETASFVTDVTQRFDAAPIGTLLSSGVQSSLQDSVRQLQDAGAELLTGSAEAAQDGCCFPNTLLRVSGKQFLKRPARFQLEAFGNASLFVVADDPQQLSSILQRLEGNLTGCIYSDENGTDDQLYELVAPILRQKVGRLINDKMPTGVAVSPAMNHGGPFPATGHPGFTAVGIPAALRRFGALHCFDNVRQERLPLELRDANPTGKMWRLVDGDWTQGDIEV